MSISAFLSYFRRSTLSAPIDILPNEILSHILVSFVPYDDHSTCSKVCRKWKEIFDSCSSQIEKYKNNISSLIYRIKSTGEIINKVNVTNLKNYTAQLLKDYEIKLITNINKNDRELNSWMYNKIHIINSSLNYKWIELKLLKIKISYSVSLEKVKKAIAIYESKEAKCNQEGNKHLFNGFLRDAIKNIPLPLSSFVVEHTVSSFADLIFHIDCFIKDNIFSNAQFVCLFPFNTNCFLRMHKDKEPSYFQDVLELKLFSSEFDKGTEIWEIRENIPRGKWHVFLHGFIPKEWHSLVKRCCAAGAEINQADIERKKRSKKRPLELENNDYPEPLLKKARNLVSYFFK